MSAPTVRLRFWSENPKSFDALFVLGREEDSLTCSSLAKICSNTVAPLTPKPLRVTRIFTNNTSKNAKERINPFSGENWHRITPLNSMSS